jgi:hypothetical protein
MAKYDAYVVGLNELLRDLRALPKDAQNELRTASVEIAERHMAPVWREAAISYAGPWGQRIADSVKVRRDRLPKVAIGGNRKAFSGGATPTMVRYQSDKGDRSRAGARGRSPAAFGSGTDWIDKRRSYEAAALREWGQAVDQIVRKWNRG